jgi:hypothetical protein
MQRMGRPLTSLLVLAPLILLGACVEMAPKSSLPFQAAAERQARYAAEMALAVKEDRRDAASEAAANGRMVLPQLPEIWGSPGTGQRRGQAALEPATARLEPATASDSSGIGCAAPPGQPAGGPRPADCRYGWQASTLVLPPQGYAWITPAAPAANP